MNWREFIVELFGTLAWPAAAAGIALIYRRELKTLLGERLMRVRAGPFEAEWDRAEAEAKAEAIAPDTLRRRRDEILERTSEVSPRTAILERYERILARLAGAVIARLGIQPGGQSIGELLRVAEEANVISAPTRDAFAAVSVLRNLAAHAPLDAGVNREQADDFMAVADAVEYALERDLR